VFKEHVAKIHIGKQNIDDLTKTVKKPKALKNKRKREDFEVGVDEDNESKSENKTAHSKKKRKLSEEPVDI